MSDRNMKNQEYEKIYELVSAYIDNELEAEDRYFTAKMIDENLSYKKAYDEIRDIKNSLNNSTRIKASENFTEKLMRRIEGEKRGENSTINNIDAESETPDNVIIFRKRVSKIVPAVAVAAMFVIVVAFVLNLNFGFMNQQNNNIAVTNDNADSDYEKNEVKDSKYEKREESLALSEDSKDASVDEDNAVFSKSFTAYDTLNENNDIKQSSMPIILGPDEAKSLANMGSQLNRKKSVIKRDSLYILEKVEEIGSDKDFSISIKKKQIAVVYNLIDIIDIENNGIFKENEIDTMMKDIIEDPGTKELAEEAYLYINKKLGNE